jgi:hypothetical protein
VADALLMQVLQGFEALDEVTPHDVFVDIRFAAFIALYFASKITTTAVLIGTIKMR